jgi:hypothetical protein
MIFGQILALVAFSLRYFGSQPRCVVVDILLPRSPHFLQKQTRLPNHQLR